MNIEEIKSGIIIESPRWPEPIEIKSVERIDQYIRIVGSTIKTRQHIDQLLPLEDISSINIKTIKSDIQGEAWKVFLAIEAMRYRFASMYDPLLAMNTSKIDPLPHQIEAVYGYILGLPTIRFLIADDPGAGKTIMAGLVIKELKLRNVVKRILIVVPGHLQDQWRRELKDRFDEQFVVVNREYMNSHYGENVWERENQIITSMDFAKQDDIIPSLSSTQFDLIIVDEAHKMAAYRYGEEVKRTDRYRLGESLSRIAIHMLFLTATPHKGDPDNFRLLLDLLQPGFFADVKMMEESIKAKDNPLFIRRMKDDLKDFDGKPLFLPRHVDTVKFRLSDREKILYNKLSTYVKEQYNKALSRTSNSFNNKRKRNIAFALLILQRRFASSIYALWRSLERRKKRLEDLLNDIEKQRERSFEFDFEEVEDLSEEERWKEEELWETLSVAENIQELKKEISIIDDLLNKAKDIIQCEEEVKIRQLKDTLEGLNKEYPNEKILIFTESRDTLEYLEKKIRSWGYSVNTIHGAMNLEERINAERIFKNETQVMVATEAAGEGINLQFCHLMINYDIPWNPNRLEQRMGRIHRYGQQKEVYVFNMVAVDTREGEVLMKVFEKLKEIRDAIGSDKVFDVIGEVFYGHDLAQLMLEAAANTRSMDEILKELDIKVDPEYIKRVKDSLAESLATRYIDYTRIKEMALKAKENRLIPEYTQEFFKRALSRAGGRMKVKRDGFIAIEHVPYEIRKIAENDDFKRRFGTILKEYPKVTFDKEVAFKNQDAEFVTFGHPLFEAVMEWVERELSNELQRGAIFLDPAGAIDGYILFYEGEIRDGTGAIAGKQLFSYYISSDCSKIDRVHPSIIWDLVYDSNDNSYNNNNSNSNSNNSNVDNVDVNLLNSKLLQYVIRDLKKYMEEIKAERDRQASIKEKYGIKSLDDIIIKLDGELILLEARKEAGENVDLVIRNKNEQKREYERRLENLKSMIEKERMLSMSTPRFVGLIRVKPMISSMIDDALHTDEEVERIGMDIAMMYERENGREPEDVSKENLGFDIRSKDNYGNVRYIEVKARADIGSVALTQNEWFKAQRLGDDYYLYVVWNAKNKDYTKLLIIRNPVKNLNVKEKIAEVRYVVNADEIEKKNEGDISHG